MFEDECSLSNTATVSYSWSEKGKQPMIKTIQAKRERFTLFGAVNPQSGEVIIKKTEKGNAKNFKKFIKKILKYYTDENTKIWMILDNVPYHHARILRPYLNEIKNRFELIYLPPYSPDLNPMERVWWYMRKKITHNRAVITMKERIKLFWQMFSHYQKPNSEITKLCILNY